MTNKTKHIVVNLAVTRITNFTSVKNISFLNIIIVFCIFSYYINGFEKFEYLEIRESFSIKIRIRENFGFITSLISTLSCIASTFEFEEPCVN